MSSPDYPTQPPREGLLEVWSSEHQLLAFDGRVLEMFGWDDAVRIHIAYEPRLEFTGTLKRPTLTVRSRRRSFTSAFDEAQRPALEHLAAVLEAASRRAEQA